MGAIEIPSRGEVIASHREAGGKVAAVLPVHNPRALLRAFDILPVEVWGPPGMDTTAGDEHLQAYTCSIVRCGLAFLLSGAMEAVDVIVVPHACDSLQGLGSLLLDFIEPAQPVLPMYLPRRGGQIAQDFLAAELRSLFQRLCEITGKQPSEGDLLAAVQREEAADDLLAQLSRQRASLSLGDSELYRVMRAREYLPAERFVELARAALEQRSAEPRPGVPLILSGLLPEPHRILEVIAEAGGRVAADDLACCGRRLYPAGRSEQPFERLAQGLLGGSPDSTRGSAVDERVEHLQRLVLQTGAKAVVFYLVKFCEPELFYLPQLREALERSDLRTVTIEVDVGDPLSHQVVTRLEALLETLS
ncbi:MAG: 2-hydroxyacyl-CoA dehydratase [Deltaproteobacteria bacterium]|nr:2-hydroxyacyl-CoA dehydratase [Deltaproteobacteria bacterium]